jgi:GH25 family lysozyme M1 (1,4-beta-N-acetylmuramidase)
MLITAVLPADGAVASSDASRVRISQAQDSQPAADTAAGLESRDSRDTNPSLGQMNAAHDHTMGSTITDNGSRLLAPTPPTPGAATPIAFKAERTAATPLIQEATSQPASGALGFDVSAYQVLNISDWQRAWNNGARFAYIKATESTDYTSRQFSEQYNDSYAVGMIRGAYHFATPNTSSGAAQANFFVDHGGSWTADGRTLPPLIDLEYDYAPNSDACWGLSQGAMVSWIHDFSSTVSARTGRAPAIYTTTDWWKRCTGNSSAFTGNPLFIARWPDDISSGAGTLPAGWSTWSLWQYADAGIFPGDQDVFNGSLNDLISFSAPGAQGGYFIRTATNPNVYLVAGNQKYFVPSMEIVNNLAALQPIRTVTQASFDSIPTSSINASLLVRDSSSGSISLMQNGIRHHFASCDLVAAFGYSCNTPTNLTPLQYALLSAGADMTPFYLVSGSPVVGYIAANTSYPVYEWSDAITMNGGTPPFVATMDPAAAARLSAGHTVVAPLSLIKTSSSPNIYLVDGLSRAYYVSSFSVAAEYGATSYRTVPQSVASSYSLIGSSVTIAPTCSGQQYIASQGGAYAWNNSNSAAGITPTPLDPITCAQLPVRGTITGTLFIKGTGSTSVFYVAGGRRTYVPTWSALLAQNGGAVPTIVSLGNLTVSAIPASALGLQSGQVVRTASNPNVYLIDSGTRRLVTSLTTVSQLGLPQWGYADDILLGDYPIANGAMTRVVTCGSNTYFGVNGVLQPLATPGLTGITPTPLSAEACAKLAVSATAPLTQVFAMESSSPTIYLISSGQKKPISSWDRLLQLNGGTQPAYFVTQQGGLGDIPTGPSA